MSIFRYCFESRTDFSTPVRDHSFMLRSFPLVDARQTLLDSRLRISPQPDSLSSGHDCWGARIDYGFQGEAHSSFSYVSEGTVKVIPYPIADKSPSTLFLMESRMTVFAAEMASLIPEMRGTSYEKALEISSRVKSAMSYVKNVTSAETTAARAFSLRQGVCQDYAHIMISVCRESGIPARYVCGMIPGEGETHAWVEIWSDGAWHGLDPTAGKICDDRYIAIAKGRDAGDCPVVRGIFKGCAVQSTRTISSVEQSEQ